MTSPIPAPTADELTELHRLEMVAIQAAAVSQMANGRACRRHDDTHDKALKGARHMVQALAHMEASEVIRKARRPDYPAHAVTIGTEVHVDEEIVVLMAEMLRPAKIRLCKLVNTATPPKVVVYGFTADEPPIDFWRAMYGPDLRIDKRYY